MHRRASGTLICNSFNDLTIIDCLITIADAEQKCAPLEPIQKITDDGTTSNCLIDKGFFNRIRSHSHQYHGLSLA